MNGDNLGVWLSLASALGGAALTAVVAPLVQRWANRHQQDVDTVIAQETAAVDLLQRTLEALAGENERLREEADRREARARADTEWLRTEVDRQQTLIQSLRTQVQDLTEKLAANRGTIPES